MLYALNLGGLIRALQVTFETVPNSIYNIQQNVCMLMNSRNTASIYKKNYLRVAINILMLRKNDHQKG